MKQTFIVLGVVAILVLSLALGAGALFKDELKIAGSVRKISDTQSVYYMHFDQRYHFDEFLEKGGATSDEQVSAFLTQCISKGFYQVDVKDTGLACSTISAMDGAGSHVWGRNFDWYGSVPIIVSCTPKDGYASISTCDFQNITGSFETTPQGANAMLAVAALYVPMDGMNEKGLCVADLEVNEGGMVSVDTDKPDLTITTAIRLLLDQAATVDEALALLRQYDIHASAGISHHLAISDATGASVVAEFIDGQVVAVDTACVTNFNMAMGDPSAGGQSAKARYDALCAVHAQNSGIMTGEQVKSALEQVAQASGDWRTQWSIVYEQDSLTASYYFNHNYAQAIVYSLGEE